MRYTKVRVVGSDGRPLRNTRVGIEIHQFAAGGVVAETTDSEGLAQFQLNVDTFAEITIYVNGQVRVPRGSIKSEYLITA